MTFTRAPKFLAAITAAAVTLSACTPNGPGAPDATTAAPAVETPASSTAPPDQATTNVESAVVRIEAQGTFVQPDGTTALNQAGVGSGFFITADGLVVTNNHVVTGAATLEVSVDGETQPRNATVVGVSECADLAVVRVEGEGFPWLRLDDAPAVSGTDVLATGFPLGTEDVTITSGRVVHGPARIDTDWASVDFAIEHDATIHPGNSGGPLADTTGQVVGVNYAGNDLGDSYAIDAAGAFSLIKLLSSGHDVDTLGINGQALLDTATGTSGVFVRGVATGSAADQVGVLPGDVVIRLDETVMATDATMSDYCDVLRSNDPSASMAVEVARPTTGEVLTGMINDPTSVLEPVLGFLDAAEGSGQGPDDGLGDGDPYMDYVTVTDDLGVITADVPAAWSAVRTSPGDRGGEAPSPRIVAGADSEIEFGIEESGVTLVVFSDTGQVDWTPEVLMEGRADGDFHGEPCQGPSEEVTIDDAFYTGQMRVFANCGPKGVSVAWLALETRDNDRDTLLMQVVANTRQDFAALERLLLTLEFRPIDIEAYEVPVLHRGADGDVMMSTDHPVDAETWLPADLALPTPLLVTDLAVSQDFRMNMRTRVGGSNVEELAGAILEAATAAGFDPEQTPDDLATIRLESDGFRVEINLLQLPTGDPQTLIQVSSSVIDAGEEG